ncbi:methyltransferase [soil metagenome]
MNIGAVADRWLAWRDKRLSSPLFQRWAAGFPLTRWIARREARALFDLVAGFVYSQVLLACVRLRLFDVLAAGPLDLRTLAHHLEMRPEAALTLLAAAESLKLVQRRSDGRYGLGERGAPLVGNTPITAMVEHHAALYQDLRDPVALLRGQAGEGALASYWPYAGAQAPSSLGDDRVADYSALMSASQPLVAGEILDAYPMSRHRCVLDVGGGDGTFLTAAAARAPHLQLLLFDLPAVADRARRRFAAHGLTDRALCAGGSFLTDPLPRGADLATLIRVVHDHDDARVLAILRAVHAALPAGGSLLLAEPMAGTRGAEPMGDAYFGFYLLAMGRGRPRTAEELSALLRAAGFTGMRLLPTRLPLQTRLMHALAGAAPSA